MIDIRCGGFYTYLIDGSKIITDSKENSKQTIVCKDGKIASMELKNSVRTPYAFGSRYSEIKYEYGKKFVGKITDTEYTDVINFKEGSVERWHGKFKLHRKIFGEWVIITGEYNGGVKFLTAKYCRTGKTAFELKRGDRVLEVKNVDGFPLLEVQVYDTSKFDLREIAQRGIELDTAEFFPHSGNNYDKTITGVEGNVIAFLSWRKRQRTGDWLIHGKKEFYREGAQLTEEEVELKPEEIDAMKYVVGETNAQRRAYFIKQIGVENLLQRLGNNAELTEETNEGKLYTIKAKGRERENSSGEKNNEEINLRLLEVVCPSTQRHYVLRVATECDTVHKARQWTFGQSVRWWEKNTPERGVVFKEEA